VNPNRRKTNVARKIVPNLLWHVWLTQFFFFFEMHVWVVLLNLNSTKVLFNFF
jgi:hypothetical protein